VPTRGGSPVCQSISLSVVPLITSCKSETL
jgi:hypothetical protein